MTISFVNYFSRLERSIPEVGCDTDEIANCTRIEVPLQRSEVDDSIFEIPLAQSDPLSDLTPSTQQINQAHEPPRDEKKRKSISLPSAPEEPITARKKKSKHSPVPRSKSVPSTPSALSSRGLTFPTPHPRSASINLFETVPLIDDDTPSSVRAALLALMQNY